MSRGFPTSMSDAGFVARNTTMHQTHMSECRTIQQTRPLISATRRAGVCDRFLIGLVAITLVRAGEVLAGEQAFDAGAIGRVEPSGPRQSTELPASVFGAPEDIRCPVSPGPTQLPRGNFGRAGHSIFESDVPVDFADDKLISDTPVWQRLSEFRTFDRVRLSYLVALEPELGFAAGRQEGQPLAAMDQPTAEFRRSHRRAARPTAPRFLFRRKERERWRTRLGAPGQCSIERQG